MRHSLSTTKDFVRIKETRHKYNRGSEWCLADSELGRWYLQITDDSSNEIHNTENCEFSRLLQLSTLIPELTSSMMPLSPDRPVLINLETCPDYLLGHVPHPELFVHNRRNTPSPTPTATSTTNTSTVSISSNVTPSIIDAYINNHLPLTAGDSLIGSPLSRKTTPKPFNVIDIEMGPELQNINIDMEMEIEDEYLDFN